MTINNQFMNHYKYEIYLENFIEFLGKSFLANQEKIVSKNWIIIKRDKIMPQLYWNSCFQQILYLEHFIEFLGKSFLANQEKIVSKY